MAIPDDAPEAPHHDMFDKEFMTQLEDLGRRDGSRPVELAHRGSRNSLVSRVLGSVTQTQRHDERLRALVGSQMNRNVTKGRSMMIQRRILFTSLCVLPALVLLAIAPAWAATEVPGAPLDHVVIHVDSISKETPIRIRAFSTDQAEIGHVKKAAHREEADRMKQYAPTLLTEELGTSLRAAGFKDVAVVKSGDTLPKSCYVIDGKFTVLHPGSQQERLWIGFGAGKSKTCIAGKVTDQAGKNLAEFDNCRVGTWWGGSEGEMRDDDSRESGNHISGFMHHWAEGDYAD